MFINFFKPRDFIGLDIRGAGITTGTSPIPGGNSTIFLVANGINSYSGNTPATLGSYTKGLSILVQFTNSNTGASTLNVNGLGNSPIMKTGGTVALASGDIIAGGIYTLVYDGANWQIVINTSL